MERFNYVLEMNNLENELQEMKLDYFGDTGSTHEIETDKGITIIKMDSSYCTDYFYGKIIKDKLYIATVQRFHSAESMLEDVDFYGEFISTGKVLA